jgi:hypothetical protein
MMVGVKMNMMLRLWRGVMRAFNACGGDFEKLVVDHQNFRRWQDSKTRRRTRQ